MPTNMDATTLAALLAEAEEKRHQSQQVVLGSQAHLTDLQFRRTALLSHPPPFAAGAARRPARNLRRLDQRIAEFLELIEQHGDTAAQLQSQCDALRAQQQQQQQVTATAAPTADEWAFLWPNTAAPNPGSGPGATPADSPTTSPTGATNSGAVPSSSSQTSVAAADSPPNAAPAAPAAPPIPWWDVADGDDYWTDDEVFIPNIAPRQAPPPRPPR